MNIQLIINTITYFSILIPVIIGIIVFSRIQEEYKPLFTFALFVATQEGIRWLIEDFYIDKLILNFYGIIETFFIGYMFQKIILSDKWKKAIRVILLILISCFMVDLFFVQGFYTLNTYSMMLESVFFMILSARLFFQFIEHVPSKPLLKHEGFWFNLGVFVYFTLNFFIFMMGDELFSVRNPNLNSFKLWDIHDFLNFFLNFSFGMALWFSSRNTTQAIEKP